MIFMAAVLSSMIVGQAPTVPDGFSASAIQDASDRLVQQAQEQREQHFSSQEIERRLQRIVEREGITAAFDVDVSRGFPDMKSEKLGLESLRIVSGLLNRDMVEINGVYVLKRRSPAANSWVAKNSALLGWLQSLDGEALDAVLSKGLSIVDVPADLRPTVVGLLAGSMMTSTAIAGDYSKMRLNIRLGAVFRYSDPVTGQRMRGSLNDLGLYSGNQNSAVETVSASEFQAMRQGVDIPYEPILTRNTGDLDFGSGQLLTLHEVLDMAGEQFGISYGRDGRIADSQYFFAGRFDVETFDRVIEALTVVAPVVKLPSREQAYARLSQVVGNLLLESPKLMKQLPGGIDSGSFFRGMTLPGHDLQGMFPNANLAGYGDGPFELRGALVLVGSVTGGLISERRLEDGVISRGYNRIESTYIID